MEKDEKEPALSEQIHAATDIKTTEVLHVSYKPQSVALSIAKHAVLINLREGIAMQRGYNVAYKFTNKELDLLDEAIGNQIRDEWTNIKSVLKEEDLNITMP